MTTTTRKTCAAVTRGTPSCSTLAVMHISAMPPGAMARIMLGMDTPAARPTAQQIAERAADLQSMLIEDWAGEVAGSTYLEEKLRIPRSTLHRWQRRGEVVALRKGGRKHVFPLAQFVDGRPVLGISEVLSAITSPRLAWFWLSRPSPELDGRVPIEMLREDMVEDVVRAAGTLS